MADRRKSSGVMPIAIIGMSGRYPGDASSPEKLWDMVSNARSARCEVPADRWNVDSFYHPHPERGGTLNSRGGHFMQHTPIDAFDAPFFSITANEAKAMDPQQRWSLECTYEAMENAGLRIDDISGSDTSVYVGTFTKDYSELLSADTEDMPIYYGTGTGTAIVSNRVSWYYDLRGPSVSMDTGCSSSLVALHMGCQSLRTGESSMSIVGGVNFILLPGMMTAMANLHFLSPDDICHSFDAAGNGYSRGEGASFVVLKPLDQALANGDVVRGIIRNTALNQDGKTPGITVPSSSSQEELIRRCYAEAGLSLDETSYVEAHGTGTPVGDPQEAAAIANTLAKTRPKDDPMLMGSVKTNVGHLEGASGMVQMQKAIFSLEKGQLAPNLWFDTPNPRIPFDRWNLKVVDKLISFPTTHPIRRVSVNSFGYGGTNAHCIIDSAEDYFQSMGLRGHHNGTTRSALPSPASTDSGFESEGSFPDYADLRHRFGYAPKLAVWSSNEQSGVQRSATQLAEYIRTHVGLDKEHDSLQFEKLLHTLAARRSVFPWRAFGIGSDAAEMSESILDPPNKPKRAVKLLKMAFAFTGQGAQWYGMGRELCAFPAFWNSLLTSARHISAMGAPWSLMDELFATQTKSRVQEAEFSQPLCTAIQVALVDLMRDWEIHPAYVAGHSSGEIAAAYAAGALTHEDACKLSYHRGRLCGQAANKDCGMMAVGLGNDAVRPYLESFASDQAVVACINSPSSVTISGIDHALTDLQKSFEAGGIFARRLKVDAAYHSPHMEVIADEYLAAIEDVVPQSDIKTGATMFSSVTGQKISAQDLGVEYWVRNLTSPVNFVGALQTLVRHRPGSKVQASKPSIDTIVELGPHGALQGPIKQILKDQGGKFAETQTIPMLDRRKDASTSALEAAGILFQSGANVNIDQVNLVSDAHGFLVDMPPFAWNRDNKYWCESENSRKHRFRDHPRTDLLGAEVLGTQELEPLYRNNLKETEIPWLENHKVQGTILYPAAGMLAMAIEGARRHVDTTREVEGFEIKDVIIGKAIVIPGGDAGTHTMLSLRPWRQSTRDLISAWSEFRVFSQNEDGWEVNCSGLIRAKYRTESNELFYHEACGTNEQQRDRYKTIEQQCSVDVDVENHYAHMQTIGLNFTGAFKSLSKIRRGDYMSNCEVTIHDTKAMMPHQHEFPHVIHPSTLDCIIQSGLAGCTPAGEELTVALIPTAIEHMFVADSMSSQAGTKLNVATEVIRMGSQDNARGNMYVFENESSSAAVHMSGVVCTALRHGQLGLAQAQATRKLGAQISWREAIDWLEKPKLQEICAQAVERFDAPDRQHIADMELAAWIYMRRVLQACTGDEAQSFAPHFRQFYALMQKTEQRVANGEVPHQSNALAWRETDHCAEEEFLNHVAASGPDGAAMCAHGEKLLEIMRGDELAIEVLSQNNYLNDFYQFGLGYDRVYAQLAEYMDLLGHQRPHMKVLEIGGGTAGATLPVLEALTHDKGAPRFASYTFTDISTGFFEKAQVKLKPWLHLMHFNKFDVESDPASQGLNLTDYDVVIAANSIHATASMENTLGHVRSLMKPNAKLVLVEITNPLLRMHMTVGSFDGWWAGADDGRVWGPTMTRDEWDVRLRANKFSGVEIACQDLQNPDDHMYSLLVSSAVSEKQTAPAKEDLIIVQPSAQDPATASFTAHLAEQTRETGGSVNIETMSKVQNANVQGKTVVFALGLDKDGQLDTVGVADWETLKKIILNASSSVWLTRGACIGTEDPSGSLMTGMARCIRAENPSVALTTVDLDPNVDLGAQPSLKVLLDVIHSSSTALSKPDPDWEYAIRNGRVMAPRLWLEPGMNEWMSALWTEPQPEEMALKQVDRNLRLRASEPGQLNSLRFESDDVANTPLDPDEVETEVKAVGLNFKDVMIAMGQLSEKPLGLECSGIVRRTGSSVRSVRVGDRVATWTLSGTLGNYARSAASMCVVLPDNLSFELAASLPVVYSTAYYALFEAAKIQRGESILIHGAAGGLGQATISLAKHTGAEIFATVSSSEKKNLLVTRFGIPEDHIFSSRDNNFLQGVKRVTNDQGVDVVLNSLAHEGLANSVKCLKPFGRFLEVGQKDIESNTGLEMAPFMSGLSFHAINMIMVQQYALQKSAAVFNAVMELFNRGMISLIHPTTVLPFSDIERGFRTLQTGQHMGKIVFTAKDDDVVLGVPSKIPKTELRPDVTYLISGGMGGLGRSIASWMVSAGARNLVFLSRSGTSKSVAKETVAVLEAAGATVKVYPCDCASAADLQKALAECQKECPPIKGVIQAAMVLKDSLFENMEAEQFRDALRPKVAASRNLHELVPDSESLDFFILLASSAGIAGSRGQCNYAAGNAYQDALATHRRSQGMRATSLDLGVVLDIGAIAEALAEGGSGNKDLAENIARWKYAGLYEKEVLAMLQAAITQETLDGKPLAPQLISGLGTGGMADIAGIAIPWWLMDAKFAHLRTVDTHRTADKSDGDTQALQTLVAQATTLDEASAAVSHGLVCKLAKMLMVQVEDIESEKPITRYGVDSLLAVELRSWIFMDVQADISVFQLMSNISIAELAKQIAMKSKCLPATLHDAAAAH